MILNRQMQPKNGAKSIDYEKKKKNALNLKGIQERCFLATISDTENLYLRIGQTLIMS